MAIYLKTVICLRFPKTCLGVFTPDFCFGKTVRVDEKGTDRYSRVIGEVFVDGTSLNRALVESGFAWWYKQYAKKDSDLGVLEEKARKAGKGLWKEKAPVAPWDEQKGDLVAGFEDANGFFYVDFCQF